MFTNLFLRYMTGVGNRNLDLDDNTLNSLRNSTFDFALIIYLNH